RRTRDTDRLATTSNPKDAQALERELASLAARISSLEDLELEVMDRVEQADAAVAAQQALIDTTTAEGTDLTAQAKAQIAAATKAIAQLTRDRGAVTADLRADLLAEYARRASRGIAVGRLRRGSCEGCRRRLSGTHLSEVRQAAAHAVISCPECGAILRR